MLPEGLFTAYVAARYSKSGAEIPFPDLSSRYGAQRVRDVTMDRQIGVLRWFSEALKPSEGLAQSPDGGGDLSRLQPAKRGPLHFNAGFSLESLIELDLIEATLLR